MTPFLFDAFAHGQPASPAPPRTLVVVVHRLAALCPVADHIVVFRDGRVVEQGTHTELLARRGEYDMLWRAQASEEKGASAQRVERAGG